MTSAAPTFDREVFTGTAAHGSGTFVVNIAVPTDTSFYLKASISLTALVSSHLQAVCGLVADFLVYNNAGSLVTPAAATLGSNNPQNSSSLLAAYVEASDTTFNPGGTASNAVWDTNGTNARLTVTNTAVSQDADVTVIVEVINFNSDFSSPSVLALTGWWRASFTGAPWHPTASAGTSGTNGDMTAHTGSATTGTAQNGLTPAHFSSCDLINTTDAQTLFAKAHGTLIAVVKPNTASTPTGNVYDDPVVYRDSNADVGLTFTTSGFGVFAYDGAYRSKYVACATGAYHIVMMRWNSTNLGLTLDSASEQTTACSALTILSGTVGFGQGYAGGFLGMDLLEIMMIDAAISDATFGHIKSYVNARYALSL